MASTKKQYTVAFQQDGDSKSYKVVFIADADLTDEQIEARAVAEMAQQGETWYVREIIDVAIEDVVLTKKPKLIVTLSDGGMVEVTALNSEEFDLVVIDYVINEGAGVEVRFLADDADPKEFNEIIDEAIGKLEDAVERYEEDTDEWAVEAMSEWVEDIKDLEAFKVATE